MLRRTRLRSRRPTPRRSDRERDLAYLSWLHTQRCWAVGLEGHQCEGPIEADHMGVRPMGRKADDATAAPLCMLAHRQRTDFSGPFRSWDRAKMRGWLDAAIAHHQRRYAYHLAQLAALGRSAGEP